MAVSDLPNGVAKPTYVHSLPPRENHETFTDLSIFVSAILSILGPILHAYGVCSYTAMLSTAIGGAVSALIFLAIKACKYCEQIPALPQAPVVTTHRRGSAPAVLSPERPRKPVSSIERSAPLKLGIAVSTGTPAQARASYNELKKRIAGEMLQKLAERENGDPEIRSFLESVGGKLGSGAPHEIYKAMHLEQLTRHVLEATVEEVRDSFNVILQQVRTDMALDVGRRETTGLPNDSQNVTAIKAFLEELSAA